MPPADSNSAEHRAFAAIASCFDTLTEWQNRGGAPYVPQPGSSLAADDEDWPPIPVSQVALGGLAAAVDHLSALRRLIEARYLFTYSPLTLCRSALVGAAQAVWVLAPETSTERTSRARLIAAYVYEERLKYLRGLQELGTEPHESTDLQVTLDSQRLAQLAALRAADGQARTYNATDMIKTAAADAFGRDDLTQNAVLAWRSGSGAAHGQHWQLYGTAAMQRAGDADGTGLASFKIGGSFTTFSNLFCAAFQIAARGWDFLELRGDPETGATDLSS
jgi:hypothetical protein